jgi:hypothetical protein
VFLCSVEAADGHCMELQSPCRLTILHFAVPLLMLVGGCMLAALLHPENRVAKNCGSLAALQRGGSSGKGDKYGRSVSSK